MLNSNSYNHPSSRMYVNELIVKLGCFSAMLMCLGQLWPALQHKQACISKRKRCATLSLQATDMGLQLKTHISHATVVI